MGTSRFDPFLSDSPCANVRPDSNKSALAYFWLLELSWKKQQNSEKIQCSTYRGKNKTVFQQFQATTIYVYLCVPDMYHTHHYPIVENTEQYGKSYNIPAFISKTFILWMGTLYFGTRKLEYQMRHMCSEMILNDSPTQTWYGNDIGGITPSLHVDFTDWGLRNSLCYSTVKHEATEWSVCLQKMQMDAHWDKISYKNTRSCGHQSPHLVTPCVTDTNSAFLER